MKLQPLLPLLALCLGCTADLRPEALLERVEPTEEARGREILERASRILHGEEAQPWGEQPGMKVRLTDDFSGFTGYVARPWPEDPQDLVFRFLPARDSAVAECLGEEPVLIGKHGTQTWRQEAGGPVEYEADEDTVFWLPTLQYFLELPFRLGEGQIVDYAGDVELDGGVFERVYVTWGSYAPHDTFDQYVAYAHKESGRIERVDFTIRDFAGFLVASVHYADFRETADGYTLPHTLRIGEEPPDDLLHAITVHSYQRVSLEESAYAPSAE